MQFYITITLLTGGMAAALLSALYSAWKGEFPGALRKVVIAFSLAIPVVFPALLAVRDSSIDVSTTSLIIVCVYTFILSLVMQFIGKSFPSSQVNTAGA